MTFLKEVEEFLREEDSMINKLVNSSGHFIRTFFFKCNDKKEKNRSLKEKVKTLQKKISILKRTLRFQRCGSDGGGFTEDNPSSAEEFW